jgi:NAD-dependent dihydropyrimidine dehydrogenase PreA subunit
MPQSDVYRELSKKIMLENSTVMPRIWRTLCTEREAEIVNSLPATAEDLAAKFGTGIGEMQAILDGLFKRGTVIDAVKGGVTTWRMPKHPIQLHDWTISWPGAPEELLELWREFEETDYPALLELVTQIKLPAFMRVIPIGEVISPKNQVLATEDAVKILEGASTIAITDCVCRKLMKRCDKPLDVCLQLNRAAEFAIKRGTGRKIGLEEGIAVLKRSRDAGLVHFTENSGGRVNVLCNCCNCCCEMLRFGKDPKTKGVLNPSRYLATVTGDACTRCSLCQEVCPMDAVKAEPGEIAIVDRDACIGCGLCAHACPTDAIALVESRPEDFIPA